MNTAELPSTGDIAAAASAAATAPARDPYRTYVLVALAVVGFMCAVDRVVISMFMEPIKKEFGLSDTQLGLLTGVAFSLMGGLASVPLARWADRGNRKWIIGGSLAAWSIMTAASGVASNFVQLLAARMGVGIGEAGCIPATHSMLGDYYPRDLRPRALGIHSAGTYLGALGGKFNQVYIDTFQRIVLSGQDVKAVLDDQAKALKAIMDESKAPCWAPDKPSTGACPVGT